jgi:hypothetical protein
VSEPWIISRRDDRRWLIGPVLASFAVLGAYLALRSLGAPDSLVLTCLYFGWAVLFDGTHVFATYSRTYFDPAFRERSRALLLGSLSLLLVGPAIMILGEAAGGAATARATFVMFNRFALTFAYYHLVRQHWGFISLYRAKARETDPRERWVEGALLGFGTAFPYVANSWLHLQPVHFAETLTVGAEAWDRLIVLAASLGAALLGLHQLAMRRSPAAGAPSTVFRTAGLLALGSALIGSAARWLGLHALLGGLSALTLAGTAAALAVYVGLLVGKVLRGQALNRPKLVLLGVVLLAHHALLLPRLPTLVPVIALTLFHNLQYHRIVRFHNVNQYGARSSTHGLAGLMTRKLAVFIVLALLFNLVSTLPRAAVNALIQVETINYLLGAFFWGIAFHHYFLDARIWRIRSTPRLSHALSLPSAALAPQVAQP